MSGETVRFAGGDSIGLVGSRYGDADAPPVVLLHGGGQTRGAWGSSAEALAAQGFGVLALDQRGHGDSDWSAGGDYRLDAFADDLRRVVATFGRAPVLVGASLGGMASLLAMGEAPRMAAAALVLVDIVPWFEERGGEQVVGFMRGTSGGFDSLEEAAEAIAGYLPHRPRPERLDGLSRNLRHRADGRWYWHWDPEFVKPREGWNRDDMNNRLTEAARAISDPVMLVRGGRSEIVSDKGVERFRALMPDAEIAEVAGAHHMVAGDDNDAFLGAILPFMKRMPGEVTA